MNRGVVEMNEWQDEWVDNGCQNRAFIWRVCNVLYLDYFLS